MTSELVRWCILGGAATCLRPGTFQCGDEPSMSRRAKLGPDEGLAFVQL